MKRSIYLILAFLLSFPACGKKTGEKIYTGVLEGKSVQVPAMTAGKIEQFFVDTGDRVNRGDTLAVIDTTELALQRKQLQAGLEELQAQKQVAETQLAQAKTNLEFVRERFNRIKALFEEQVTPQQNLDDAENQLRRARTAYRTAREQMNRLSAQKKRLLAQLEMVANKIKDAVITAPRAGVIATRYYEPGEAVAPFQPVVEIIHTREMEVKIYLAEEMLPRVKIGQNAVIRVDGWDQTFPGKIIWISPRAEFSPKTILTPETRASLIYAAKVRVANPDGVLKHGMPVEVSLKE